MNINCPGFPEISKTLSEMVLEFYEFGDQQAEESSSSSGDDDDDGLNEASEAETRAFWEKQQQLLQEAMSGGILSTEKKIRMRTEEAMQNLQSARNSTCDCLKECHKNCPLQFVADRLRDIGYNSALCKSKWRKLPDSPPGEHTYIDIMMESRNGKKNPTRVIIELNFRAEFKLARTSQEYDRLMSQLPEIFVGKSERLRDLIKIMCSAAKKCMKDNKMHIAPWRKYKYMQSKWLGTCERITTSLLFSDVASERPMRPRASLLTSDLHCKIVEVV